MNELYLHFPGQRVANLDDVERLGFGSYLDRNADGADISVTFFDDIAAGPRGENGSLVVISAWDGVPPNKPVTIDEANQYWVLLADESTDEPSPAWIGYRRDFPPTPDSLRRRKLHTGTKAKLGGEEWQLPILLRLPLVGPGPDGTFEDSPMTEADRLAHRFALNLFVELRKQPIPEGDPNFCPPGCRPLVEYALTRNYRGDWRLWQALGLFDAPPINTALAMMHAIGAKAMVAAQEGEL